MNPRLAAAFLFGVGAACHAQTAPVPATAAQTPPGAVQPPVTEPAEPNVRHIVIEDEGSRIDELRVRGQTLRMVVTPKVGLTKSYEIIVSRGGRAPEASTGGANSALGKRVWNLLDF